eukprot:5547831-Prymnesium_polylepis.1
MDAADRASCLSCVCRSASGGARSVCVKIDCAIDALQPSLMLVGPLGEAAPALASPNELNYSYPIPTLSALWYS